jgi:hypothetical protein
VCAFVLAAVWLDAAPARADDAGFPEPPATFLSVGPAVQVTPECPGARDSRTFLLPDIEGQYHNGLGISATDLLGVYADNHGGDKLGAASACGAVRSCPGQRRGHKPPRLLQTG